MLIDLRVCRAGGEIVLEMPRRAFRSPGPSLDAAVLKIFYISPDLCLAADRCVKYRNHALTPCDNILAADQ